MLGNNMKPWQPVLSYMDKQLTCNVISLKPVYLFILFFPNGISLGAQLGSDVIQYSNERDY